MAQIVKYFENDVIYTEGPFVLVWAGGWRIEVELKGHHCPILLDSSIYKLLESNNLKAHKSNNKEEMAESVDWLNQQVREGLITLQDGQWKF